VIGHGGAGQPRSSNTPRRRPSRYQARSSSSSCGDSIAWRSLRALALLDPQQHALGVDVADLERVSAASLDGFSCYAERRPYY
jgi:hypothetical protein